MTSSSFIDSSSFLLVFVLLLFAIFFVVLHVVLHLVIFHQLWISDNPTLTCLSHGCRSLTISFTPFCNSSTITVGSSIISSVFLAIFPNSCVISLNFLFEKRLELLKLFSRNNFDSFLLSQQGDPPQRRFFHVRVIFTSKIDGFNGANFRSWDEGISEPHFCDSRSFCDLVWFCLCCCLCQLSMLLVHGWASIRATNRR